MGKTPFRAWRERLGLTQASAASLIGRSKRSVEMLDQAETLDFEIEYACRWIERYVIPESFVPAARNYLEHAHSDGSEVVLEAVEPYNWHPSQTADRKAAADLALQKLKTEKNIALDCYESTKEELFLWVKAADDFVSAEDSVDVIKILPTQPSRSISIADVFDAAVKVALAKEAVEGGETAVMAVHQVDEFDHEDEVDEEEDEDEDEEQDQDD